MTRAALVCALFLAGMADAGSETKPTDRWAATANQKRLQLKWSTLDAEGPPRPLLLYVIGVNEKEGARIEREVFTRTGFVLAAQLCRPVRITPEQAAELAWLRSISPLKDPMLIAVGVDRQVHGALAKRREFTAKNCLAIMAKAADGAYPMKLPRYVRSYVKILEETERLLRREDKLAGQETRAAKLKAEAQTKARAAIARERAEIASARQTLRTRESMLKGALKPAEVAVASVEPTATVSDRERTALRAYRKRARAAKNPIRRAAALDALSGIDSPTMAEAILHAVRTGDSWTVTKAGALLGNMRSEAALDVIIDAFAPQEGVGSTRARHAALLALSHQGYVPALPGILSFLDHRDPALREACVRAMGGQADAQTAAAIGRALSDADPAVRVLAVGAVLRRGLVVHAGKLLDLLADRDGGVRKAAVEALGELRAQDALPTLVRNFAAETGPVRVAYHDALVSLTGEKFLYDVVRWRAWWKEAQDSYAPPGPATLPKLRREIDAELRRREKLEPHTYHSIRLRSRNLAFVIDVSANMANRMDLPKDASAATRKELWKGSKLDLAKRELIATLKRLDPDVRFNVFAFAGGVQAWRRKPASAAQRKSAIAFVRELKPILAPKGTTEASKRATRHKGDIAATTKRNRSGIVAPPGHEHERNHFGALLTAFGIRDDEPLKNRSRPPVDTIVLVSDGGPTFGDIVSMTRLLGVMEEINRTRGVVIHSVSFAESNQQLFDPLVTLTGGRNVIHGR